MSRMKFSFVAAIVSLCWLGESADKSAEAQVSVQLGTPTYYSNQPVYRNNGRTVYVQPNQRYSQPYVQSYTRGYTVVPQPYTSGYRGYNNPPVLWQSLSKLSTDVRQSTGLQ